MHPILKGVLARCASLVPSAVATLLASRLILKHYDIDVFNAYTLVFTTMVLIPLNDLGAGAALTSAVAADGSEHPHTRQVALTAARVLFLSGLGLAGAAIALSALGLWHDVLGGGAYATGTFGFAMAAYGLSFIPGLGQSALLGANKNDLTILVQAFLAPAMCVGAALSVAFDLDARWVVVVPGIAVLLISLVNAWVSARVTHLHLLPLLPKLPFRRRYPGATIRGIAGPALIITLTSPIILQGDRLVLSHFSTAQAVANYSVTVQIWAPLVALIAAAARPLWPMFTQARVTGVRPVSISKIIALFVTLAAVAGAVLCVIAGPLAHAIGGDQIHLGIALPVAMAVAVSIQAAAVPLAMVLMYPAGLRLIATLSLITVPINLAASIIVAGPLGAPGPLYVSIVIATFLQMIPAMVHLRRHGIGPPPDRMAMAAVPADSEDALFLDGGMALVGGGTAAADLPRHEPDVEPEPQPQPQPQPIGWAPPRPPAPPLPQWQRAPAARDDLEALVTEAVERALAANPTIHLQLDPTVQGPESVELDSIRRIVARIDRQAARLEGVAQQLDELSDAVDGFSAVSRELADHQEATDPPPGTWTKIQRGDDRVRRALDELIHTTRDRRRKP